MLNLIKDDHENEHHQILIIKHCLNILERTQMFIEVQNLESFRIIKIVRLKFLNLKEVVQWIDQFKTLTLFKKGGQNIQTTKQYLKETNHGILIFEQKEKSIFNTYLNINRVQIHNPFRE
ncbi:unnamed protein product [Paramecium sonneborni]|uniref:Uncharacterized protein n=1 Tax=Paramecium sonneborni TaxID=65129 RepID=A0A8S1QZF2_9CILI|nr:unnamed protein product [Paramecium sonneborni]